MPYTRFIWDDDKDRSNQRKHGVSFDEDARLTNDPDHSANEDRFLILGRSRRLRLLMVCHCYRKGEEVIRITSARKATKLEFTQYGRK